ncbi:NAD-dependent epimerase/dehydratase family protein [Rhodoligotrophos defluvii]|uniref:NAD-dependent epimerase/dehydratase family protein n=1 Tax=Rhodoligotrophos defluvii TaxID=2561934 RepID=UPI0010C9FF78|nr:NAD-dependent epimerase/dehydratase family protein [Rhodoligotrophos defluvii]
MTAEPDAPAQDARRFGVVERFRPGDYDQAERAIAEIARSGASHIRTGLSWAEYHEEGGKAWFDWLIPKLAAQFDLLPCLSPPWPDEAADALDHLLIRYGHHFQAIELPWDGPEHVVGTAARRARQRGHRLVLGGLFLSDLRWLDLMGQRGLLEHVSAVGLRAFPATWRSGIADWTEPLGRVRALVGRYNRDAETWITEVGHPTWRNDEAEQVRRFLAALDAPADRIYWSRWRDEPVQDGLDPQLSHLGATMADGRPKLLARLLMDGGVARARQIARLPAPAMLGRTRPVAVLGGSGFIGSNLARSFLARGDEVIVIDNLSRPGVDRNLDWLMDEHGSRVHPVLADIRDPLALEPALRDAGAVFHLAAQTAVTTSLADPLDDFEINARGTMNVLEAVRRQGRRTPVIFASTNKVYGSLDNIALAELDDRYVPADEMVRARGISEARSLDFCTPYGCSKGVADQYVLDYAKSYGIPTAVLRMSCIYGPRQFGTEDQGWVAHFLIRALQGEPIVIYGDGKQVRDILHVDDAVAAYRAVLSSIDAVSGHVFNLGGGPRNAVSLRSVIREIGRIIGRDVPVTYSDWRKGDQLYFVANTGKLEDTVGWSARRSWREGLADLASWLRANRIFRNEEAPPLARVTA